jgi:hypothetical protein
MRFTMGVRTLPPHSTRWVTPASNIAVTLSRQPHHAGDLIDEQSADFRRIARRRSCHVRVDRHDRRAEIGPGKRLLHRARRPAPSAASGTGAETGKSTPRLIPNSLAMTIARTSAPLCPDTTHLPRRIVVSRDANLALCSLGRDRLSIAQLTPIKAAIVPSPTGTAACIA